MGFEENLSFAQGFQLGIIGRNGKSKKKKKKHGQRNK